MHEAIHPDAADAAQEWRLISLVCAAHFVSHYYILLLPPLFIFVRNEYGVSYTELSFALTIFGIVSALLQMPAGFLVDRVGARPVLLAGLAIGSAAFLFAGLVNSFWVFVVMFGLAGIGNTAYHPADYALLSHGVSESRAGHAYSAHNFAGMLGGAVAPTALLVLTGLIGWRGTFVATAVLGFVVAAAIALAPRATFLDRCAHEERSRPNATAPSGLRLLVTPTILLNWIFFALFAFFGIGLQNYSAIAIEALFGIPLTIGNFAMTAHLIGTAAGVLLGGYIAVRIRHYDLVAIICMAAIGIATMLIGVFNLGILGLIAAMTIAGICTGACMPSRDLLVRSVTPAGAFGKVFGFLSTGFNFAAVVGPIVFGLAMDTSHSRAVFLISAVACFISILVIALGSRCKIA